jgi:GTP cyclohydrolase I
MTAKMTKTTPMSSARKDFHVGYTRILRGIAKMGYAVETDPNFAGTDARAADALAELVWPRKKIERRVKKILGVSFPLNVSGSEDKEKDVYNIGDMVMLHNKSFFGVCPHHLLPVIGQVNLAYIPSNGRVLGISKLARLVDVVSKQPMLQEAFVQEIANHLYFDIKSTGSAVIASAIHLCMACRGARAHETAITVAAIRGAFEHSRTRKEFYYIIRSKSVSLLGS